MILGPDGKPARGGNTLMETPLWLLREGCDLLKDRLDDTKVILLVRSSYRQPEMKSGGLGPSQAAYQEPKQYAFGTREELAAFLDEQLGPATAAPAAGV